MRKSNLTNCTKEQLVAAIPALDSLRKELEERLEAIYNESISAKSFDNPNWAYHQAYTNGQLAEVKRLLELIDIKGE